MRKIVILIICVLFFVACEQKTDLVIHNLTSYYLDYTLDGVPQRRIEAGDPPARHSYSIGRKYLFLNPTKEVRVRIWGPVYQRGYIGHDGVWKARPNEERPITLRHDEDYRIRIRSNRVNMIVNNVCTDPNKVIESIRLVRGIHVDADNLLTGGRLIYPGDPPQSVRIDRNVNDRDERVFIYRFRIQTTDHVVRYFSEPEIVANVGDTFEFDFCSCVTDN